MEEAVALLVTAPGATVAQSYACNVSNSTPIYTTTGSEFPKAGKYSVQLEYKANGEKFTLPSPSSTCSSTFG